MFPLPLGEGYSYNEVRTVVSYSSGFARDERVL